MENERRYRGGAASRLPRYSRKGPPSLTAPVATNPTSVRQSGRATVLSYVLAVATPLAAAAISFETPWLRDRPYLLPVAAVALAAWQGGFRPAMVASAVGLVAVNGYLARTQG